MEVTEVVLADDHPFMRIGIRNILNKTGDISVIGEASDGIEALWITQELEPDILLLDMEMPGMLGLEVTQELQKAGCEIPVLAISAHDEKHFIFGMLLNGAAGYIVKDEIPETLIKAIRSIAKGQRGWVSPRVAALLGIWMKEENPETVNLTTSDLQLLELIAMGKQSEEIGAVLGESSKEVEEKLNKAVRIVRSRLNGKEE
ncbi:MAG: DNA-binding response regulator [Chloroflexi bacterium]|nr:MAG: DNA-binding response regulator [Chloroflexota bacterium]